MKKVEHYICELCGTEYKEKEMCTKCEKGHKKPTGITGASFAPITSDGSGYPVRVKIVMSDGKTITYKRY